MVLVWRHIRESEGTARVRFGDASVARNEIPNLYAHARSGGTGGVHDNALNRASISKRLCGARVRRSGHESK